jgi:hypothetical protein
MALLAPTKKGLNQPDEALVISSATSPCNRKEKKKSYFFLILFAGAHETVAIVLNSYESF